MTPLDHAGHCAGRQRPFILRFLAHASMPFGFPVNGTIVINATNSSSLVIPFNFTKVSVTTGDLAVNAVNQFTFFDPAQPAVAGATVEVRHAFSNALLAQGITDASGQFNVSNLPEGTHRLIVSKPQHLPYDGQVTINPGATQSTTTFLNYQVITFSWAWCQRRLQDQYDGR
ncbi:MAG: carboxypeptidase regulatory-like domain-containing protein [Flavobacteriales bacterium]|nr:carboxypeptidase regulatory-like domain-containing protein [Flavobacteriales bacterium]